MGGLGVVALEEVEEMKKLTKRRMLVTILILIILSLFITAALGNSGAIKALWKIP